MAEAEKKKFVFSLDPNYGRCLKARKTIFPGEVVIEELAIVEGPSPTTNAVSVCPSCYSHINSSIPCPLCSIPFCHPHCYKNPVHAKNECSIFKAVPKLLGILGHNSPNLYQFITVLRCLLLKNQNSNKWTQILQLQSNQPSRSSSAPLQEAFLHLSWDLLGVSGEDDEDLPELALRCLGVLQTNSFSQLRSNKSVENLYFFSSFMAHSCIMNTERQFDPFSSMVIVSATREIQSGELITNTYLPFLLNTAERFQRLSRPPWRFVCQCIRCQDPTELNSFLGNVQCPNCKLPSLSPSVESTSLKWKCSSCNEIPNQISVLHQILGEIEEELKSLDKDVMPDWLERNEGGWLHPNHSILINLKLQLCQSLGIENSDGMQALSISLLQKKAKYGRDVLLAVEKLTHGHSSMLIGRIMCHIWLAIREIHRRGIEIEGDWGGNSLQNYGMSAYHILKYARVPGTDEWRMKEILCDEGLF